MEKPDVDGIDGIAPAFAIRQKNSVRNPRSTVGTTTELHDYLRLLWARVGRTICRRCGREVERESPDAVAGELLRLPAGTRLLVGFDYPIVRVRLTPEAIERESDADDDAQSPNGNTLPFTDDPVLGAIDTLRRRGFGRPALLPLHRQARLPPRAVERLGEDAERPCLAREIADSGPIWRERDLVGIGGRIQIALWRSRRREYELGSD